LLYLGNEPVTYGELRTTLEEVLKYRAERQAYVFGEPNASYGEVVKVVSIARQTTENTYVLFSRRNAFQRAPTK
jgi:biopolymer transport protein ExbD